MSLPRLSWGARGQFFHRMRNVLRIAKVQTKLVGVRQTITNGTRWETMAMVQEPVRALRLSTTSLALGTGLTSEVFFVRRAARGGNSFVVTPANADRFPGRFRRIVFVGAAGVTRGPTSAWYESEIFSLTINHSTITVLIFVRGTDTQHLGDECYGSAQCGRPTRETIIVVSCREAPDILLSYLGP